MRVLPWTTCLLALAGCATTVPLSLTLPGGQPTRNSGIGVVVVVPRETILIDAGATQLPDFTYVRHRVPAGTLIVGLRLERYPPSFLGDIYTQLVGRKIGDDGKDEYIIGSCEYGSLSIMKYYGGAVPLPSIPPPEMNPGKVPFDLSAVGRDRLFGLARSEDWVTRFHAIGELVRRGPADDRLYDLLDNERSEPVFMVSALMGYARYNLFTHLRPPEPFLLPKPQPTTTRESPAR